MKQPTIALTDHKLIQCQGKNVAKFLQGQLTCDVLQLANDQTQLCGYCNQKGRLLGIFWLIKHEENYYLSINQEIASTFIQEIIKYAQFSQITFLVIDQLLQYLIPHPLAIPTDDVALTINDSSVLDNYSLCLTKQTKPADQHWQSFFIANGIPYVTALTSAQFTPQQVNLDCLSAVCFNKGCYRGQEIVARMHYLGKVKQRMFRAQVVTNKKITAATLIIDQQQHPCGEIVTCYPTDTDQYELLITVFLSAQTQGDLFLSDDNAVVKVLPLPYQEKMTE